MAFSRGTRPQASRPLTCNKCRVGEHNRCPTAITNHGRSSWTSDFECTCYEGNPDMHADLVEQDDEEFYSGHEPRSTDRWDSVGGQFGDW